MDSTWLSSNEILKITGISRATLNNYIKYNIIPRAIVKKEKTGDLHNRRIGYFPGDVLSRIEKIKKMKKEGKTMENIIKTFSASGEGNRSSLSVINGNAVNELKLSINDIHFPAYLVNNKYEIEWINDEAEKLIFHQNIRMIRESTERNIFKLLFRNGLMNYEQEENSFLTYLIRLVKINQEKHDLNNLYNGILEKEVQLVEKIYERVEPLCSDLFRENFVTFRKPDSNITAYKVYNVVFREGILIIHGPVDEYLHGIVDLLSRREKIISELLKERMPALVSFCVLVADLQDSSRICAELPPEEYFALIRDIWKSMSQVFKKYYGTYGKHVGDGMVYYFLKDKNEDYILNSINCAIELREEMTKLSMEWKMRKGWFNDLYLNIGVNEGQEFFGTIPSSPHIEFTALGDSVNYAGRISDFARYGTIWTTKNLLNRIDAEKRKKIRFGIRRKEHDREVFIENMFSRVIDMLRPDDPKYTKFMDIATLAITEVLPPMKYVPSSL